MGASLFFTSVAAVPTFDQDVPIPETYNSWEGYFLLDDTSSNKKHKNYELINLTRVCTKGVN